MENVENTCITDINKVGTRDNTRGQVREAVNNKTIFCGHERKNIVFSEHRKKLDFYYFSICLSIDSELSETFKIKRNPPKYIFCVSDNE